MEIQKKVTIVTNNLNCERHTQYYGMLKTYFQKNGWQISNKLDGDKIIIAGCGFHDSMYEKVRNTLDEIQQINKSVENVVISGCLPKTHAYKFESDFEGIPVPFGEEKELDQHIQAACKFSEVPDINVFDLHEDSILLDDCYYIKVSTGCLRECTYCVIKKAKGRLVSKPVEKVVSEYKDAMEKGYRKIMLMGEDTLAYGWDTKGKTIIDLIQEMIAINPDVTFYFGPFHSKWLEKYSREIIELCRGGFIKKLHFGLQHVNGELLKKMGRQINFGRVYETIKEIKKAQPDIRLSADIIVGFPAENEQQFQELSDFFEEDECIDVVQHFGYSDVFGSQSEKFSGKVSPMQKSLRWNQLNNILGDRSGYNQTFGYSYSIRNDENYYFV